MVTAKSMPPHCKYKKIYSSALLFLLLFATPTLFLSFITKVEPTANGLLPLSASIATATPVLAPAPAAIPARREHGVESGMSKKSGAESPVWYQFCTLCP